MYVANCPWSAPSYVLIIDYAANLMIMRNSGTKMGFKVGDTVQLKSGSPRMTVTLVGLAADGKEVVECAWFDGTQRQNGSFPPEALRDSPVSRQARP
jgi:uncharacterized protein YodC (DUF2158 family)